MPSKRAIFTGLFMVCLALGTGIWLEFSDRINWAWAIALAFLGIAGIFEATMGQPAPQQSVKPGEEE